MIKQIRILLVLITIIIVPVTFAQTTIYADHFETQSVSGSSDVVIHNTSGSSQGNRPISLARVFRQGDIPQFAQAVINGQALLTQVDVKNRWPEDNSLKFAIVSFVIPNLATNSSVTVQFSNQASGNNEGFLNAADMLAGAYNFDGNIIMQGANSQTISAREMLAANHFRYWLQGPIVTAVIIEDRTLQRSFDRDFGDGSKALHPIFEAWFYPANNAVELGYTVENTWASRDLNRSMRDLSYSLTLTSGNNNPTTEFTQPTFKHIGRSRWHRRFWLGTDPATIRVDYNSDYLVTTQAIPHYDTSLDIAESLLNSQYNQWQGADKTLDGDNDSIGNYNKDMNSAGQADWIGLMNTWDTLYLLTMDQRMREKSLGNADLAGRIPMHFREADSQAGIGDFFDSAGTVDTFGRVISVNARKLQTLTELNAECNDPIGDDIIRLGTVSYDGWGIVERDHMVEVSYIPYLMTGRYYYLEELHFWAAYVIAHKLGCYDENWTRQGEAGYLQDSQVRGDAWGFRTLSYAAFIAVDNSPEKNYFEDILANNIAKWEGERDIANSNPAKQTHWNWGNTSTRDSKGPSPLGIWKRGNESLLSGPVKEDGSVLTAQSPWEENFLLSAFGMARQFGYNTDGLLRFMAKKRFNILLNPQVRPYLIEAYRHPAILAATNNWIQTWSDFENHFSSLPTTWELDTDVDHGYAYIALGALSFLYDYQVDSYSGQQAWDWLKANKPEQNKFASESPKWAITPHN